MLTTTADPARVLAIGPLPPPVHGLSKAFEVAVRGLTERAWSLDLIDTSEGSHARRGSAFTLARAAQALSYVARAALLLRRCEVVYIAITQSKLGFLKDGLILNAARAWRRPVVVHLHGGNFPAFFAALPRLAQARVERALSKVCYFVVEGETLRDQFAMLPGGRARTRVVYNPSEIPAFRELRAPPTGEMHVLYLSNLMLEKGYLDVLQAGAIARQASGIRLELHFAGAFVAGDGSASSAAAMQKAFEEQAQFARAAGVGVSYHGVVHGEQKRALLERAHVFVLPTYYRNEGQPLAVVEALSSALPVVATAHRGIPELLPDEMRLLCVPPREPEIIARRLCSLVSDPALFLRLSRAAAVRAGSFAPARHVDGISRLLLSARGT